MTENVTMILCPDCGGLRYLTAHFFNAHGQSEGLYLCDTVTCDNEGVAESDIVLDDGEELVPVSVDGRVALAYATLDLPDFDTVEAAGFDGTLRTEAGVITWRMVAERMVETFGIDPSESR